MTEKLTEDVFTRQLHSKFRVHADTPRPVELELVEVKGWRSGGGVQGGMERFSLFFTGPADILVPQRSFSLDHNVLGLFDLFLVHVSRTEAGLRIQEGLTYYYAL